MRLVLTRLLASAGLGPGNRFFARIRQRFAIFYRATFVAQVWAKPAVL